MFQFPFLHFPADTEFKLRYEAQKDLNKKLAEQTEWYSSELATTKEKFNQGNTLNVIVILLLL